MPRLLTPEERAELEAEDDERSLLALDGEPAAPRAGLLSPELRAELEAPDEADTGGPAFDSAGRVYVENKFGRIGTVDPSEVSSLAEGMRLVSRERVAREILRDENESTLGQLQTAGEQALQGITLGAYGAAARALSPEYRERMDARAEDNPGTALVGNVVGSAAPMLLTGGAGALARGGAGVLARGAAMTPAGLAGRAGAAVARGLGGAAPSVVRSGLAGAAGGAVEGAVAAGALRASELTPEQLANPREAAENLLAAASTGSVLGGFLGGAFGAGARALQGGAARLEGAATRARPQPASPPPSTPSPDFEGITVSLEARPLTAAAIPEPPRGKLATLAARAQAAQGGFEEAVQEGTKAIRHDFDEVLRGIDQVDEYAGIAAKQRANRFNVGHPVSSAEVDELLTGIEGEILVWQGGRSRQGLVSGGGLAALEGLKKSLRENGELIRGALKRGDVGTAYGLLDQGVKGFLGKARNATKAAPVQDLIEGIYPRVQRFLEDEATWGELAARQKIANPSWSNRIAVTKDGRVQQFTTIAGERGANGWDNLRLANDGAIKGLLANLGDAGNIATEEAFRTQLRALARDATDRTRAWGSQKLQEEAIRVTNAVQRIEDRMDAVGLLRRDAIAGARQMQQSTVELLAGAAGVVAPPVGWAITGTAQAGRKLLQAVGTAGSGVRATVANAAAQLVRTASETSRVLGQASATPAAVAATAALPDQRLQEAIAEARQLSHAGSPATLKLLEDAAEIEQEDPELAESFAMTQLRRAQFINAKLPKAAMAHPYAPPPALDSRKRAQAPPVGARRRGTRRRRSPGCRSGSIRLRTSRRSEWSTRRCSSASSRTSARTCNARRSHRPTRPACACRSPPGYRSNRRCGRTSSGHCRRQRTCPISGASPRHRLKRRTRKSRATSAAWIQTPFSPGPSILGSIGGSCRPLATSRECAVHVALRQV